MIYSALLKHLLKEAEKLKESAGTKAVSVVCLITAILNFCEAKYSGLSHPSLITSADYLEEERLRYLRKKLFHRASIVANSYFRFLSKHQHRKYDTDFMADHAAELEMVLQLYERPFISADFVLLFALQCIAPEHRFGMYGTYRKSIDFAACINDMEENILDFTITSIENVQENLQKKLEQIKSIRDFQPAIQLMDPNQLLENLFGAVRSTAAEDELQLQIPHFFGDEEPLKLCFRYKEDCYYVHDCGCALAQLRKHTTDEEHFQRVFDRISKNLSVEDGRLLGTFVSAHIFFHYLQILIFTAHADLYWEQLDDQGLYYDPDHTYPTQSEPMDAEALLTLLQKGIDCRYDPQKGLLLSLPLRYSLNTRGISYCIETASDKVIIKDGHAGELEGEILESFYWGHDDITPYIDHLSPYLQRFGGTILDQKPALLAPAAEWMPALFRFFNLAILFSELGRLIDLPEVKE